MTKYILKKNKDWQTVEMNGEMVEIPKDWATLNFGKSFSILGGGTPPTTNPSFWNGAISWVGPKDMASRAKHISHGTKTRQ